MPEAFVCANDAMAITVSIYLSKKNIRVPTQVRVAGFDGIRQGVYHEPTITTMRPDFPMMFDRMLDRIQAWRPGETGKTEVWSIPFELVRRGSCGCEQVNPVETTRKIGQLRLLNLTYTRDIRALGNSVRRTLGMKSLEELTACLSPIFSFWSDPYYCAAVLDEQDPGLAHPVLHGVHNRFTAEEAFRWQGRLVPDFDALCADLSVRIVMAQLLQGEERTMGYIVAGMEEWSLREQQRFEELALFLSAALNAVITNRRLEEANNAILQMAEHDYLTGLYNRRGFLRALERGLERPEAQDMTLTLFAMDMDRLKAINDSYGHHEGDFAIQCLARAIRAQQGHLRPLRRG